MPKVAKSLNQSQLNALKPGGIYNVGGVPGLHIQITPNGAKSWLLRASVAGRVREMGLGSCVDLPLKEAREKAREIRVAISAGRDPISERRQAKLALVAANEKALSFKEAAEKYFKDVKAPTLRSQDGRDDWLRTMERHAFSVMGSLSVADVELRHVLAVLEPLWPKPLATGMLRPGIEAVLEWSAVRAYRPKGDNPAAWRTLKHVLAAAGKAHKVTHHAALPYAEAAAFFAELRSLDTFAAKALRLVILTAARSGEVRGATWDEIDLGKRLWTVPAERMKSGKTHHVPLPEPAVELLESLPHREGLLFGVPSKRKGGTRALYDFEVAAPNHAIGKKLERQVTVHGWRSVFKDWARNYTSYADEVSELALAHVSTDATRAAYARDELISKREQLMTEWAKYLLTIRETLSASVTPIGTAKGLTLSGKVACTNQ